MDVALCGQRGFAGDKGLQMGLIKVGNVTFVTSRSAVRERTGVGQNKMADVRDPYLRAERFCAFLMMTRASSLFLKSGNARCNWIGVKQRRLE